jgi:DNA-binding transcriptional MerR regulator
VVDVEGTTVTDELLPIGRFARLVGLSVGALRHYDDTGVLVPAHVDPATGYRRYRRSQVDDGRTVALLRELEVPLDDVRAVLAEDDPAARRRLLARHRERVAARVVRLQRVLHTLTHLVDPDAGHDHTPEDAMTATTAELDAAAQTALAKALFNRTWELLETADRTPAQDEELVHCAHASRYHWGVVGGEREAAIGDWQVSRAYAVLGRGEPAVHHARRALAHAQAVGDSAGDEWLLASAYEGLARAYAVAGDRAAAQEWKEKAVSRLAEVPDADDREIVENDLATLPLT